MAEGGASYLMQVRPYRDLNNVIDGAVVTFVDISERKKHEQARGLLAAIVEGSQDAIVSQDLAGLDHQLELRCRAALRLLGHRGHRSADDHAAGRKHCPMFGRMCWPGWSMASGSRSSTAPGLARTVGRSRCRSRSRRCGRVTVGSSALRWSRATYRAQGGRAEGGLAARRARPSGQEHPGGRVRRGLADAEDHPAPPRRSRPRSMAASRPLPGRTAC